MITQVSTPIIIPVTSSVIFQRPLPDIGNSEVDLNAADSGSFRFDAQKIPRWNDFRRNGIAATQSSVVAQPSFGVSNNLPGVKFGGLDHVLDVNFTYDWTNNPFTIIAVASKLSGLSFEGIIGNRFGAGSAQWFTLGSADTGGGGAPQMEVETTVPFPNLVSTPLFDARDAGAQIYEYNHIPSGNDTFYLNGTLQNTQSAVAIGGVTNDLKIGRWLLASQTWNGFMHQILIYSKSITTIERDDLNETLIINWPNL